MRTAAAFLLTLLLVGCQRGPVVHLNTADDVQGEIERISAELPPEQAAEFRTAAEVLALNATRGGGNEVDQRIAVVRALDGKSVAAVVAYYKAIEPAVRNELAKSLADARNLKAENDRMERVLNEIKRMESASGKPSGIDAAVARLMQESFRIEEKEGRAASISWLESQIVGKSPEEIIAAFPAKP